MQIVHAYGASAANGAHLTIARNPHVAPLKVAASGGYPVTDPRAIAEPLMTGLGCIGPGGDGELDCHHWALWVERTSFSGEGRGVAADRPYLNIRRRFADDRGHHACESTEVDLDVITDRLARRSSDKAFVVTNVGDDKFHQPRLRCDYHHGDCCYGRGGRQVLEHDGHQPIRQIRWQIEMIGLDLFLPILSCGMHRDFSGLGVNQHIRRMRKGRSFLDVVVADQLEGAALREACRLIVNRAVFEMKDRSRCDAAASHDLEAVS